MGSSLKKQLSFFKWRTLACYRCCGESSSATPPPSIEPSILKQQFLPVLCVGSTACKGYIMALHQLTSPTLLYILSDAASEYNYCGKAYLRTLIISCEPDTFEATFCLLQRSFKGLVHIPLSRNAGVC